MFRFIEKKVWLANRVKTFNIVEHPGSAAVFAIKDHTLLLVEQYRPAAQCSMLELPGGTIEGTETPRECAERELKEETGCTARHWKSIGKLFLTPGYTTEILHLFNADDLQVGKQELPKDEVVRVRWMPLKQVERMIAQGTIGDSKTIAAFYKHQQSLAQKGADCMTLYELPGCPYCAMVIDKLKELDLDYESIKVPKPHSERDEVKDVSGQTSVPVLVDGDIVLADENDIVKHLEEKYR